MISKLWKENKGIVVADALIAILIMSIFIGVISTLCYNIYISASFTKRNGIATNYGINIMEYIEKLPYDDVTEYNLVQYINTLEDASIGNDTPYRIGKNIQNYNETPGNIGKKDLIKIIKVEIKYNLGDSEKIIKFEKIKKR